MGETNESTARYKNDAAQMEATTGMDSSKDVPEAVDYPVQGTFLYGWRQCRYKAWHNVPGTAWEGIDYTEAEGQSRLIQLCSQFPILTTYEVLPGEWYVLGNASTERVWADAEFRRSFIPDPAEPAPHEVHRK